MPLPFASALIKTQWLLLIRGCLASSFQQLFLASSSSSGIQLALPVTQISFISGIIVGSEEPQPRTTSNHRFWQDSPVNSFRLRPSKCVNIKLSGKQH